MHPPAHPHRTRSSATTRCHHLRTPDSNDPLQSVRAEDPKLASAHSPCPPALSLSALTHHGGPLSSAQRGGQQKGLPETTSERPSSTLYI